MMQWLFPPDDDWLTRLVLQRALGMVYTLAFLVTATQFRPLLGECGLLPVRDFVQAAPFRRAPSIFQLHYSDRLLTVVAWTGVVGGAAIVAGLPERWPTPVAMLLWFALWALYLSIVNVGQNFYGFFWETLLLEAGFLAIFLGSSDTRPPLLVIWLFRWLLFRLEFGAGLIKVRSDRCWRDLTCLYYHHETQPMPNPLSWHFHHLPRPLHRVEVAVNHVCQLVLPFGLFSPQPVAGVAGTAIVATQLWLLLSGNFAWVNLMTVALAVSAFDDAWLRRAVPLSTPPGPPSEPVWHLALVCALTGLVVVLSWWPVRNLASGRQLMNASFDPLHLVNTYGAFGNVTRIRLEVVIEGTDAEELTPSTTWREYEFKGKPGDPRRRPPQVAPYHLRLDWLMWFVPLRPGLVPTWFVQLLLRLLLNDGAILRLLRRNPFPETPPTFVRVRLYRYRFTSRQQRRASGCWWDRELVGDYLPPMALRA